MAGGAVMARRNPLQILLVCPIWVCYSRRGLVWVWGTCRTAILNLNEADLGMNRMNVTSEAKPIKTKTVCLSHKEDADGICSAALIREAFGGDAVLVDYPGQMAALEEIVEDMELKTPVHM